jgi:hypothetical protein
MTSLAWRIPIAAAAGLLVVLGLAACAPAVDPDTLYASLASTDLEERQDAAEKLEALIQKGDYDVFVRGLKSSTPLNRAQSIMYLGRVNSPEAHKELLALLAIDRRMMLPFNPVRMKPQRDPADSRILVAEIIHRTGGDPEAVRTLLHGAEENQTSESLVGTCFAVGALRDPAGLAFLDKATRHPEPEVVRAAVQATGQFTQPEALAILERMSTHPSDEVRADVLSAVSSRDDDGARRLVEAMGASDPSPDIRASAYQALTRFKASEVAPYLIDRLKDVPAQARPALLEALGRVTGQSLGAKPEAWQRWWARQGAATAR